MSEQKWPCIVCGRDVLKSDEERTCVRCLGATRRSIIRIEQDYQLLPLELLDRAGAASPMEPNGDRHGDGDPLPGGDLMVLLGPGSTRHHGDAVDDDVDSILGTLERWETDWRITFGDGQATERATIGNVTVYLLRRLSHAARNHGAFDEFATDVRDKRHALDIRLGLHPQRSDVPCTYCKTRTLEREIPRNGVPLEWRCTRCHRGYTESEYYVAARQHGEERHGDGGGTGGVPGSESERDPSRDQAA